MERSLGRKAPSDWKHVEKYPMTAALAPTKPANSVVGTNWYRAMFRPVRDSRGYWWIGVVKTPTGLRVMNKTELGPLVGGHAYAIKARGVGHNPAWHEFYDQDDPQFVSRIGSAYRWKSGGCTGFSVCIMQTLSNRKRYDPYHIYHEDQKIDEWPGEDYEGSSVRAALDVARMQGLVPVVRGKARFITPAEGIAANRWITSYEEWKQHIGYSDVPFVDKAGSWGTSFPRLVRIPDELMEMLWLEDGEISMVTDL
jgi:hypothetical protein